MRAHVSHPKRPPGSASRRSRRPALPFAFVVAALGWALFCPPPSYARVNPLVIIERQIHKANMLIVLDTSGSMTGVPGGTFSSATEAGVDCNNGVNCKESGIQATCKQSGRICMTNDDCRVGHCSLTTSVTCADNEGCSAIDSKCSITGETCTTTCPAQPSSCSATGAVCDNAHPCAALGKCAYGGTTCNNPGGDCAATKYCAKKTDMTCASDAECPQASSGGNCAAGGTPALGLLDPV
jgi:hypothetical protein